MNGGNGHANGGSPPAPVEDSKAIKKAPIRNVAAERVTQILERAREHFLKHPPASRRKKRTPETETLFLGALEMGVSVAAACDVAKISSQSAYKWRDEDPVFARHWDESIENGTDRLEDEAVRRAMAGSDTLLIFMLKGRRGDKFKDRSQTENFNVNIDLKGASDELNRQIARIEASSRVIEGTCEQVE